MGTEKRRIAQSMWKLALLRRPCARLPVHRMAAAGTVRCCSGSAAIGEKHQQYCRGCGSAFTASLTSNSRTQASLYPGGPTGELCQRCQKLESEDIFAARDGVRDVPPHAFQDTLRPVLRLREAICLQIVDANDFDATCISDLLEETTAQLGIEHLRTILVVNKKDLCPRLDKHDMMYLRHRASHGSIHCMQAHAVSAITGEGVPALATAVVDAADGRRNVIVCGAASVGKSTLINMLARQVAVIAARSLPQRTPFEEAVAKMLDDGKSVSSIPGLGMDGGRSQREHLMRELKLTVSHMPGTTIESLQVKCFASWSHSMYDTPGVIVPHSLAYALFPVHVMAPLMQPAHQRARTVLVRAGESLLLEAAWIGKEEPSSGKGEPSLASLVLGRIDVGHGGEAGTQGAAGMAVRAVQLSSPAVSARVVPTAAAPSVARVPAAHVDQLRDAFLRAGNAEDAEALSKSTLERPLQAVPMHIDAPYHHTSRSRSVEVTFANIGSVTFLQTEGAPFRLDVRAVEGSKAWHRAPLYDYAVGSAGTGIVVDCDTPPAARSYDVATLERNLAQVDAAVGQRDRSAEEAARALKPTVLQTKPVQAVEEGSELERLQKAIDNGTFTDEERARFRELVFGEPNV